MPLTFTTEDSSDGLVLLKLAGSLDAMTAPELLPTIDRLVDEKRTRITVNLEGLDLIDSSGVAAIVALYKRTRSNGGRVTVTGARDQPLAIFKLLRMDRVFAL
ncbi:MAG TPA: STAS domain-containing protein [Kofleriaceae bacterium]|nr:STAS domain-containing protein [Kofleriaceae bacterium]